MARETCSEASSFRISQAGRDSRLHYVTFTDPEVAQVGLLESDARDKYPNDLRIGIWPLSRIDRAVCDNDRDGFIKFVTTNDGLLLGATIVAESAGETIIEAVYALQKEMKVSDLASPIHPYPTYTSGVQMLATEMAMEQALTGTRGTLIRTASKVWRYSIAKQYHRASNFADHTDAEISAKTALAITAKSCFQNQRVSKRAGDCALARAPARRRPEARLRRPAVSATVLGDRRYDFKQAKSSR